MSTKKLDLDKLGIIRMAQDTRCAQDGDCCTRKRIKNFILKHGPNMYKAEDGRVYVLAKTLAEEPFYMDATTGSLVNLDGQHQSNEDRVVCKFTRLSAEAAAPMLLKQFELSDVMADEGVENVA